MNRLRLTCASAGVSVMAFLLFITPAYAAITVTPAVVDLKGFPRDILRASLTLENTGDRYEELYPSINSVNATSGTQGFVGPGAADQSSSLANWIELSRASIMLKAGEKRTIDFIVNVNLRASSGMYHALISFAPGSTRSESEANSARATVATVNLNVPENIKERMEIRKFISDKDYFPHFPVSFSVVLENFGNVPESPHGEIRIYNKNGEEVETLPLTVDAGSGIVSHATSSAKASWAGPTQNKLLAAAGVTLSGWGRYKAYLDVSYGDNHTLNDTVYFYVIPWGMILGLFIILALIVAFAAMRLHGRLTPQHPHAAPVSPSSNDVSSTTS